MDTTNDNLYDMIAQEILEMSDYYQGRGYTTTDSKDGVIDFHYTLPAGNHGACPRAGNAG